MIREDVFMKVSSRHIGQLGRELVTDYVTALTELVKNAYDADAEAVEIIFENLQGDDSKIYIIDTGNGFTKNDIKNKWAVIGTNSKIKEPYSPKYKRRCVGRKGIGRFSVERLAEYCKLYSFTESNEPIKYSINWNDYEGLDLLELKQRIAILRISNDISSAKYVKIVIEKILSIADSDSKTLIEQKVLGNRNLSFNIFLNDMQLLDEIEKFVYPILYKHSKIEKTVEEIATDLYTLEGDEHEKIKLLLRNIYKDKKIKKNNLTGTVIELSALRDLWTEKDIAKVSKELRLLISPLHEDKDSFSIVLRASDYEIEEKYLTNDILDSNYAIVEASFDDRSETISYKFLPKDGETIINTIPKKYTSICGSFNVKLFYFKRDSSLVSDNIKLGDAKNILDIYCGVKIYRDSFRVRPYGEVGNDWLLLDNAKTKRTHGYLVGNNQLIGSVKITSDGNPLLIDATNREGIIENEAYNQLKEIVLDCIKIIQEYRYKKYEEELKKDEIKLIDSKKERILGKVNKEIEILKAEADKAFEKKDLAATNKVFHALIKVVNTQVISNDKIYEEAKEHYQKKLNYTNDALSLYKNLASIGILAGSFGHETDDAMARIILNTNFLKTKLLKVQNGMEFDAFNALAEDHDRISSYSDIMINFLKKKNREYKKGLSFKKILSNILIKYRDIIKSYNIDIDDKDVADIIINREMLQIDVESIIINMVTNAFEALKGKEGKRTIKISASENDIEKKYQIVFEDSGDGVPKGRENWIFMPLNTTKKEEGVGLGLTIVKDIVEIYKGNILPVSKSSLGGAKFIIEFNVGEDNE